MRIVFIGPPGAGKGTQSQRLIEYVAVPHLSSGDILRKAIEEGEAQGQEAARYMSKGRLVPDELVVDMLGERLRLPDCALGCLLDGFPRTVSQAQQLDKLLSERGEPLDLVLELAVDREEIANRLELRAQQQRRADDTPETIRNRLEVYDSQTTPLLDYYENRGILSRINGMGSADEVFEHIRHTVDIRKKAG